MANHVARALSLLLLSCLSHHAAAATRVIQLVAENPSPFVSADPNDPKFIVALFGDEEAALLLPDAAHTRSTLMTNAAGQQFNCSIPFSSPGAGTAVSQLDAEMTPAYDLVKSPFELLESLDGMCLYRQDGLWTYELCHRQQVRQFRQVSLKPGQAITLSMEGGAAGGQARLDGLLDAVLAGDTEKLLGGVGSLLEAGKKAEDFSCGHYNGDEQQSEAILEDLSSSGHPLKYVSHKFSGGASCVLTGRPRTAEVRYTCTRGSNDNVVLSVREFPTCNYVVVVSTPFLCKHPSFEPPEEDVRVVSCVPVAPPPDSDSQSTSTTNSKASSLSDAADSAAAAAAAAAASEAGQAGKGKDAAAGSTAAAAAVGSQTRKRKRPSGLNRSPEYVEDATGDDLLLLRPQQTTDELNAGKDPYADDDDYVPEAQSVRGDDTDELYTAAATKPDSAAASDRSIEQQEDEELSRQEESHSDKSEQQQEGQGPADGAAGAPDEL